MSETESWNSASSTRSNSDAVRTGWPETVTPCIFLPMFAVEAFLLIFLRTPQGSQPKSPANSIETVARLAEAAKNSNHLSEAVDLYREGVRVHPTWSEGWWSLASVLYEQDRFSEAQAAFHHFAKLVPNSGPAYAFLALCEYETGEYELSLRHFEAWSKSGAPGTDALIDVAGYHWALLLTKHGQFQQALYLLAAKAKKLGGSPDLAEAMGLASLRMTSLPIDYPQEQRELVWLAGEAAQYASLNETGRSEEYAKRLAARYPQTPNVHYFLGTLLQFQRKFAEAAEEYERELKISPQCVPALTELAMMRLRTFEPNAALALATRAVELDPSNARARYAQGKSLLDLGRPQEGLPELLRAKQLAPRSALVRAALANAYRLTGQTDAAKREAAVFLELKDREEVLGPAPEEKATTGIPESRP